MSNLENGMSRMNLGGGRGQRGGGRVQGRGGRVQGGWSDRGRGRGLARGGRGGAWNKYDSENDNEPVRNGNGVGVPSNLSMTKLQYTHSETHQDSRKGVKPEEEMLSNSQQEKKRNTENFKPCHDPTELRVMFSSGVDLYPRSIQTRDVIFVPDMFGAASDFSIYNKLHDELKNSGLTPHQIWSSWHGDSHLIANDKVEWSKHCPTFHMVLSKIRDYFRMDIAATRLNWYRDSTEWKPFHHDAAAIKEEKAQQSNLTVAVSFGLEREAAFEHAKTKTIVSMAAPNGSAYVFARDINVLWRHGILQMPPEKRKDEGRISVIAWGWVEQEEA